MIPFVQNSGDELAKAITSSSQNSTNTIDTIVSLFDKELEPAYKKWDELGLTDGLSPVLNAGMKIAVLELAKLIFSIAIAVNLLLAKIMVNLLLSVGILFVGFALFHQQEICSHRLRGFVLTTFYLTCFILLRL